jgi:hypothetical protein
MLSATVPAHQIITQVGAVNHVAALSRIRYSTYRKCKAKENQKVNSNYEMGGK